MKRLRQRGFLLNPYRFSGTVQSGAFSADGVGGVTLIGASTATAVASMDGAGTLTGLGSTVQTAFGAFSSDGVGAVSIVGASTASGAASADGVASMSAVSEPGPLIVDAAEFDGVNDKLSRASAMTGQTDSKTGIVSFWHKGLATPGLNFLFVGAQVLDSKIFAYWGDGGVSNAYTLGVAGPVGFMNVHTGQHAFGTWRHVLWSFNVATGTSHLYVTDVSSANLDGSADGNIAFAAIDTWVVGDSADGGFRSNADLAELYIAPGQFLDFSVTANRRKFITAGGKPVNLGSTGSTPTGVAPLIYLHLDDGETANNFASNRIGAGNLTVTGTLDTAATSPSD